MNREVVVPSSEVTEGDVTGCVLRRRNSVYALRCPFVMNELTVTAGWCGPTVPQLRTDFSCFTVMKNKCRLFGPNLVQTARAECPSVRSWGRDYDGLGTWRSCEDNAYKSSVENALESFKLKDQGGYWGDDIEVDYGDWSGWGWYRIADLTISVSFLLYSRIRQ